MHAGQAAWDMNVARLVGMGKVIARLGSKTNAQEFLKLVRFLICFNSGRRGP